MTQFVRLKAVRGPASRVNVASILRYYHSDESSTETVIELIGGGMMTVFHSVDAIDDMIRTAGQDAIISGG